MIKLIRYFIRTFIRPTRHINTISTQPILAISDNIEYTFN